MSAEKALLSSLKDALSQSSIGAADLQRMKTAPVTFAGQLANLLILPRRANPLHLLEEPEQVLQAVLPFP